MYTNLSVSVSSVTTRAQTNVQYLCIHLRLHTVKDLHTFQQQDKLRIAEDYEVDKQVFIIVHRWLVFGGRSVL